MFNVFFKFTLLIFKGRHTELPSSNKERGERVGEREV